LSATRQRFEENESRFDAQEARLKEHDARYEALEARFSALIEKQDRHYDAQHRWMEKAELRSDKIERRADALERENTKLMQRLEDAELVIQQLSAEASRVRRLAQGALEKSPDGATQTAESSVAESSRKRVREHDEDASADRDAQRPRVTGAAAPATSMDIGSASPAMGSLPDAFLPDSRAAAPASRAPPIDSHVSHVSSEQPPPGGEIFEPLAATFKDVRQGFGHSTGFGALRIDRVRSDLLLRYPNALYRAGYNSLAAYLIDAHQFLRLRVESGGLYGETRLKLEDVNRPWRAEQAPVDARFESVIQGLWHALGDSAQPEARLQPAFNASEGSRVAATQTAMCPGGERFAPLSEYDAHSTA
jgi:hypothetical protein